jgi:rubredoxin
MSDDTNGGARGTPKCVGSGMTAIHSDTSYTWLCPVCYFRLKSRADDAPIVRPHADRRRTLGFRHAAAKEAR